MLYVYKDHSFKNSKKIKYALSLIRGIGLKRAENICNALGFSAKLKIGELSRYNFLLIVNVLKRIYGNEMFLVRVRENRVKIFLAVKSYRAIKYTAGLPIRGQRTRTNAKTFKALKNKSSKKLKHS